MKVYNDILSFKNDLKRQELLNKKVGFVPTMGALHQGHISLLEKSLEENDITVCSIYVNPTQFNNSDDFKFYPRTYEEDKIKLEQLGIDILFAPDDKMMYPDQRNINLDVGYLEEIMEGSHRPGHFKGVALIVAKLLHIVNPDKAYFGQKDLQQFAVIHQMVKELFFDVSLVRMPIVRENDGLAMSSRNRRLTAQQRKNAPLLYQALISAKENLLTGMSVKQTKEKIKETFTDNETVKLEYFEVVGSETLLPKKAFKEGELVACCIAAYLGEVRLIDNIIFALNS